MKIDLYHAGTGLTRDSSFYGSEFYTAEDAKKAFAEGRYERMHQFALPDSVATVEALEWVWSRSQNRHDHWREVPCRSSMVGDIAVIDGRETWVVARVGWEKLAESVPSPA